MVLRLTVTTTSDSIAKYDFVFDAPEITIGRSVSCHVQLPFPTVSSHHLTLLREGSTYLVADVGSTNGTTLNGDLLERDHYTPLKARDRLVLTDVVIDIALPGAVAAGLITGEETGDLVRAMASHYLSTQAPQDENQAYLEVLQGPDVGLRRGLPPGEFEWHICSDPIDDAGGWRLSDPRLCGAPYSLRYDGDVYALTQSADASEPTWINGFEVTAGTTMRVRAGSRIHCGDTTLLFADPLEDYLEQLERPVRQKSRTAPHLRPPAAMVAAAIAAAEEEGEEVTESGVFPHQGTQRIRSRPAHKEQPRTAAGLPLTGQNAPELAKAARKVAADTDAKPPRRVWTAIDLVLLALAGSLGLGAIVVMLMLFDVV